MAVVTGQKDISAAAKALKNFGAEFDKLKIKFGYLNNQRLEEAGIVALADLPSLDVLRAKMLGLFVAPATKLAILINTPASHAGAGHQGEVGEIRITISGLSFQAGEPTNNNNVNRRFKRT
jgi:ribosomal protein L10